VDAIYRQLSQFYIDKTLSALSADLSVVGMTGRRQAGTEKQKQTSNIAKAKAGSLQQCPAPNTITTPEIQATNLTAPDSYRGRTADSGLLYFWS